MTPTPETATLAAPARSGSGSISACAMSAAASPNASSALCRTGGRSARKPLLVINLERLQDAGYQVVPGDGGSELDDRARVQVACHRFEHRVRNLDITGHGLGVVEHRALA